jgi:hypothetical protein
MRLNFFLNHKCIRNDPAGGFNLIIFGGKGSKLITKLDAALRCYATYREQTSEGGLFLFDIQFWGMRWG